MSSDIAIKVENLSKCYRIYDTPVDRFKQFVIPRIRRLAGLIHKQYYHDFWALKDLSFEVKKGETVGIIGRNGSGKSTLLQIICGTLNPTTGCIQTNGRVAALLELGSGFNPEFTGRENVYLNGAVLGLEKNEIDQRFNEIAAFADIGEFIDQPVKSYSSGMMMRLAFAVIAHVEADILVVDEALSVGDAVFVQKCNNFLRNFQKRGTLLFVSHSMHSVLELCNRSIWIDQGEIHLDDEAKEVLRHYSAYIHQQINNTSQIAIKSRGPVGTMTVDKTRRKDPALESKFQAKIYAFDPDTPYWGAGGAEIVDIMLVDDNGQKVQTIEGGAPVNIRVVARSNQQLINPIVGFSLRNQRGVYLISENTSNAGGVFPTIIAEGVEFYGEFQFFLPYLPVGEYFLGGAVADRPSGEMHLQHHRRDDALRISVLNSHVVFGTFSMPMDNCEIKVDGASDFRLGRGDKMGDP